MTKIKGSFWLNHFSSILHSGQDFLTIRNIMADLCNSGDKKLDAAVNQWLKVDKNPDTKQEVLNDIKNSKWDKLKKTMLGRQKFGTAGLRGKMAAGFKCMNDIVIIQTAQGLCSYLQKVCCKSQLHNGLVIGFDGRYNSERFAELTAKVFVSASIPVHLFSDVCPTPLVSYATKLYDCIGGVMVTASHNPKEDNGYKVYWSNGSQIIPPHENNILEEIESNLEIPDEHWEIGDIRKHKLVEDCTEEITTKYINYIAGSLHSDVLQKNKSAAIKIVYTAMHGVGYKYMVKAFEAANLQAPISVIEQQNPNPDFPTVNFPNPEESECLALSRQLAEKERVKLVLANDPDADRLAVAEFDDSTKEWTVFTGNQMGSLLGWWLLQQYKKTSSVESHEVYFIASVVSSKMLRSIASAENCHFVETLTGFKWMGNTTLILSKEGKVPLFAYEEAIGYMCNAEVPDKDGVSAAVHVASLASHLYASGLSLKDQLHALYKQYGYHVSHNSYYMCHDPVIVKNIFRRIRNYHSSGVYPKKVGACEILSISDFAVGVKIPEPNVGDGHCLSTIGTGFDTDYKCGEMIMFRCKNGLSVTIRTSGTEPKIKFYTELVAQATSVEDQKRIEKDLKQMVQEFVEDLLQPKENGLVS